MERRQFLAVAGSVAFAGCAGLAFPRSSSGGDGRDGDSALTADDPAATGPTGGGGTSGTPPAAELEIFSTASGTIDARFQLKEYDSLRTVHERTRELEYGERAYLSGRLTEGTNYLFDLSVDDSLLVERPVYAGERVVLEIADRHTVRLVERRLL
ncbi:hypothetical protein [Haloarchaeobius iranensis]|uniref:Uncharacterized protein n=1 Tax=Haloarchaeobius iranensis TaxID=996166 RepID=A0A1G9Z1G5_9EURY|nr:hypothetical protein [Haloarchaeobius iranensis]SDN15268.1 hypothetical protein SAMN05192554_11759 [Haloarchaeobius iranensis]